ncbi:MAG: nuclease-related domain-containing protein [Desulfobacteraceae bacterium]
MTNDPTGTLPKTSSVNWYLVTSHLNLYYMMAAGLILPESGFGKKYYKDLLSLFPGRIVLFADTVPARAIEMVKEETSHLIPCIAQVILETLTGPVISIDRHGNVRQDISFPNELDGSEAALIIPAPLPISWMDRMFFESQVSLNSFKESAGDFENVDLQFFGLKVNKKKFHTPKRDAQLFETQDAFPWPHAKNLIKDVSVRLNKSFAAGGILAMLHKMADRSSSAAIAFQLAFHPDVDIEADFKLDPLIHRPWQWGQEDLILAAGDDLSTKIFWGVVDAVADCIGHEDIHPNDAVFNFLKIVVDTWQEVADNEKLKNALQHSLNLTNHRYKCFGEIDFLICGKAGLFVLEVKGGSVGCQKGVWHYTNRYGVVTHSPEGPFKQAQSALHGLMSKLSTHFSHCFLTRMTIGYGVLFPDCEWTQNGAEWDDCTWIDSRSFNSLEEWLTVLFEYWGKKQRSKHPLGWTWGLSVPVKGQK